MIRTNPKEPYKGLKRTPMKRKPPVLRSKKSSELRYNPPKKHSGLTIRIDPLDTLVSEYVRKRSKGFCQRCGKYYGWKRLQACHFFSRKKKSVRYDSDNIAACDFGCHRFLDGNPIDKIEFFGQLLGEEKYNLLFARMRITHPKPDKKLLTIFYQTKIKELGG